MKSSENIKKDEISLLAWKFTSFVNKSSLVQKEGFDGAIRSFQKSGINSSELGGMSITQICSLLYACVSLFKFINQEYNNYFNNISLDYSNIYSQFKKHPFKYVHLD